jgi:hypothetical protein
MTLVLFYSTQAALQRLIILSMTEQCICAVVAAFISRLSSNSVVPFVVDLLYNELYSNSTTSPQQIDGADFELYRPYNKLYNKFTTSSQQVHNFRQVLQLGVQKIHSKSPTNRKQVEFELIRGLMSRAWHLVSLKRFSGHFLWQNRWFSSDIFVSQNDTETVIW